MNLPYVFDFDGVLHSDAEGWMIGSVDFTPLRMAQRLGVPVVVMTCNQAVAAEELRRHGFAVFSDIDMTYLYWQHLDIVLVTGRKVVGAAYFDDRALNARYGQDWDAAFEEAAKLTAGNKEGL
jgi:hypothetical protein